MEQIEVISWKTLDALKQASHVLETIGDLDTNEQTAIFCQIEEDFFELYYSELESNYIRHFEDEEEMYKYIDIRKSEFGEDDFDSVDYYEEEEADYDDLETDDYDEYGKRNKEEDDDF
ncbi:MAG: hypothetical protein ACM3SY_09300 [Candidatus Omnitrophota bacterium]